MMMMSAADEEAYRHFKDTLEADLKQNIKPVIISLTMLAEDYKQSSQVIAKSIEEYILHVPAEIKILGLYLMDSIMKNLKYTTNYTTIFEKSIINLFIKVFECVDESNRKALYKLRQTWNELFSNTVLYQIDISVKRIDPAWPVTANPSSNSTGSSSSSSANTHQQQQHQQQQPSQRSSPTNSTNSKSILLNQTNIIGPSVSASGQPSTTTTSHQTAPIQKANTGQTSSAPNVNKISQELNTKHHQQQQQQPQQQQPHQQTNILNRHSPTNVAKEIRKDLEFLKRPSDDNLLSSDSKVRDPRLAMRKQQPPPTATNTNTTMTNNNNNNKPTNVKSHHHHHHQEPMDTASSPSSSLKKKHSQTSLDTTNKQALKRSSPSTSSIQSLTHEIKKPKLQQPQQNGEKVSPTSSVAKPSSSSPKSVNKFNQANSSPPPPQQQQQVTNNTRPLTAKIPKLNPQTTEETDVDPTSKQQTKQLNKIPKKDDRHVVALTKTETPVPPSSSKQNKTLSFSHEKLQTTPSDSLIQVESTNTKTKSIPSLFDIQPIPVLNNKKTDNTSVATTTSTTSNTTTTQSTTGTNSIIHNNNNNNNNNKTKQSFTNVRKPVTPVKSKPNQQASNNTTTKSVKPLSSTNLSANKKTSDLPKTDYQKKQMSKSLIKSDDLIFGNDEDVDERFSNTNSNSSTNSTTTKPHHIAKSDDLTQQIKNLNDLISSNVSLSSGTSSTSSSSTKTPPSNELIASLFDSNNKIKPNVLALIASKQPVAKPKLIEETKPLNNEPAEPKQANITELFGMIKTLINQLETQQQQQQQIARKDASPPIQQVVDESQPMEDEQEIENNNTGEEEVDTMEDQENQEEEEEEEEPYEEDDSHANQTQTNQTYYDQVVSFADLPPIKPRDKTENQNDSLLIIDGRSYRIQPEVRRLIKVYYHDHELFCDTRTKEVFVDQKRVYKMGEPTKEIMLNGRRVRLMYMGKRIEIWIDGLSYHFRADSPPKQISLTSSQTNQIKRYYVTVDSRTMDMFFDNYKVCQANGVSKLMVQLAPNDFEYHEISFVCPPKRIMIDGVPRMMRYDLPVPCIEMENGVFYVIRFSGKPREIYIDDIPYLVPFDKTIRIKLNGRAHELAWGGPGFEVIIDGRPYELQFNKPSREIIIGTRPHFIYICGDAPDVKICGQLPYELLNQQQQQQGEEDIEQAETTKSIPPLMQSIQSSNNFIPQQQQQPLMSQPAASTRPNINELLNSLLAHKIIKPVAPKVDTQEPAKLSSSLDNVVKILFNNNSSNATQTQQDADKETEKLPDLTNFEADLLKKTYPGAIQSLYSGHQCATCGNRFNQNENGNNSRYRKHLDWHFRQNRKEKDEINKAHSRAWYYILQDWIQYEELTEDAAGSGAGGDNERQAANADGNEENADVANENGAAAKNSISAFNHGTTCPATDDIDDKCYVCQDPFEIFFHEEKDEWHFKDAIRMDNRIYHPICYEDARDDQMSFHNNNNNATNRSINDESVIGERLSLDRTSEDAPNQTGDSVIGSQNENVKSNSNNTAISKDNHLKNEPKTP